MRYTEGDARYLLKQAIILAENCTFVGGARLLYLFTTRSMSIGCIQAENVRYDTMSGNGAPSVCPPRSPLDMLVTQKRLAKCGCQREQSGGCTVAKSTHVCTFVSVPSTQRISSFIYHRIPSRQMQRNK